MKISHLIHRLQGAMREHGDLEIFTPDADIGEVVIVPCRDGVQRLIDGIADEPNELVLDLLPAR